MLVAIYGLCPIFAQTESWSESSAWENIFRVSVLPVSEASGSSAFFGAAHEEVAPRCFTDWFLGVGATITVLKPFQICTKVFKRLDSFRFKLSPLF